MNKSHVKTVSNDYKDKNSPAFWAASLEEARIIWVKKPYIFFFYNVLTFHHYNYGPTFSAYYIYPMEIPVIRILVIALPEENVAEYVFLQNELLLLELFLLMSARIMS